MFKENINILLYLVYAVTIKRRAQCQLLLERKYSKPFNLYKKAMSLTGVPEVDFQLLLQMALPELFRICQTNLYLNSICNDDYFWQMKVDHDYGADVASLKHTLETYKEQYLRIYNTLKQPNYLQRQTLLDATIVLEKMGIAPNKWDAHYATMFGYIPKLEWLEQRGILPTADDARYVIDIDTLRWLASRGILPGDDAWHTIMDSGNSEALIHWLLVTGPQEFPELFASDAVQFEPILYNWAAKRDLETLQWLVQISGYPLDEEVANTAVMNDKLEILEWLNQQGIFPEQWAIDEALEEEAWSILG